MRDVLVRLAPVFDLVRRLVGSEGAPRRSQKLGTFLGVFTPTILTILGVIMYLRFGWVVGHLGLGRGPS